MFVNTDQLAALQIQQQIQIHEQCFSLGSVLRPQLFRLKQPDLRIPGTPVVSPIGWIPPVQNACIYTNTNTELWECLGHLSLWWALMAGHHIFFTLVNQIPMITKKNTNTNFWACPCELYNIESGLTKPLIPWSMMLKSSPQKTYTTNSFKKSKAIINK